MSICTVGETCFAQTATGASSPPSTRPAPDARPSPLNAPGYPYPMVEPQGRAYSGIVALSAQSVVIGVGRRIPLNKADDGA